MTAWGYAAGTGLDAIQYLLADPVMVPPARRADYTEEIVDLPSALCYAPPVDTPAVAPLPARARGFVTFGAFNRLPKISPLTLETWARVLLAVPSSRLLIKCSGADISPERDHLLAALAVHGISADRVTLRGATSQPEHLAAHGEIDVMLDTFPQSGGITTLDALLMGVPVVALMGERMVERSSGAFMMMVGLGDLAAPTHDAYVDIAARLAGDLDRLERERATLRERLLASPLGDAALYTRSVEAAYRTLWRRWCDEQAASSDLRLERSAGRGTRVRAGRQVVVPRRAGVAR
jgi:predicted O-linked N-acetylglucosamine transferase (SPINDLY family)